MESEATPEQALADLRRAEVLVHTRYPVLGRWYPPAAGIFAGLYVLTFDLPDWAGRPLWAALVVIVLLFVRGYVSRRGVMPSVRRAPAPIRREMNIFVVGCLVVVAGLAGLWQVAAPWVVAATAAVVVTAGVAGYERRYARAAERAERDLLGDLR